MPSRNVPAATGDPSASWDDLFASDTPSKSLKPSTLRLRGDQLRIDPQEFTDASFGEVVDAVRTMNWGRGVKRFERDVPKLWNEAVSEVPGRPQTRLNGY